MAQAMDLAEGFKAMGKLEAQLIKADRIDHPVIVTKITDEKIRQQKIRSFERIMSSKRENEVFKARFRILAACSDVTGMVKSFNPKTWWSARPQDKEGENLVYQAQFHIEDASRYGHGNLSQLLLYTHAGHCPDFFQGIAPSEIRESRDKLNSVQAIIDKLTKFGVFVEAAVERTPEGHLLLRDTVVQDF